MVAHIRRLSAGMAAWVLVVAATIAAIGPANADAPHASVSVPASVLARVQSGDLIFRRGTELVSTAVRVLGHGSYSHVGMLIAGPHGWRVVNAVPAEAPGRANAVVSDKLAFYTSPARASALAIYHVEASPGARARAVAWARAQLGRPFGFNAQATYCTKLVWMAWRQAGAPLHVRFTTLHIPLVGNRYLLPADLLHSPRLHLLWRTPNAAPAHRRP